MSTISSHSLCIPLFPKSVFFKLCLPKLMASSAGSEVEVEVGGEAESEVEVGGEVEVESEGESESEELSEAEEVE